MPASISAARCQYPGCCKSAKYGLRDEPPIACQSHKRAGQFTVNRRGELLMATRDGDAFRTPAGAPTVVPPSPSTNSEPAGTAATDAQSQPRSTRGSTSSTTTTSASSHRSSSAPSRSKTSSKPSPAAMQTLKRANQPGLSSGGGARRASQEQKKSCLFPGCDARPAYGLPRAEHAVYCFSHKKAAMELISEDALDAPPNEAGKASVAPATVDGKKMKARPPPPTAAADRTDAKKARRTVKVEIAGGQEQRVKNGGDSKAAGRAAVKGAVKAAAAGGSRGKVDSSSSSPPAATAPAITEDEEERTTASATVQPHPPSSVKRLADTSGMSPSGEFLVLKQAREAAKKEAEASGGGRRARAPSRRALEASGRMKDEGAQWMTREKKAEQARVKKELREQRRQYRAAGLSVGVVVEAYVANGTAAATGTGDGAVGGGGGEGGGVGWPGPAHGEPGWRKVSPALLNALPPPLRRQGKAAPVAGEMPGTLAGSTAAANSA
eukprot:g10002.t1